MARLATIPGIFTLATEAVLFPIEGVDVLISTSTNSRDTAVKRGNSSASIKHLADASGHVAYQQWYWGLQGNFGYYVRRYFYLPAIPSANTALLQIADNSGVNGVYARVISTGQVELHTFTAAPTDLTKGTTTLAMAAGQWYCWELYAKFGSIAGQCECAFRITSEQGNFETIGPFTGLTLSTNMLTEAQWGIITTTDANLQVNSCHGAINDDQGSTVNRSYPGPVTGVYYALPVSDNARSANWLNGAAGTTNLWDAVDNAPPTGVADGSSTATSQIKNSNQAGAENGNYDANVQDYVTAGLGIDQIVSVAQSVVAVGSSTAVNVSGGQLIVSNPAQSVEETWTTGRSTACGTFGQDWQAHWGVAQNTPTVTSGVQPVVRVGRRSAGAEAGNLEVAFMALAFETTRLDSVADMPTPPLRFKVAPGRQPLFPAQYDPSAQLPPVTDAPDPQRPLLMLLRKIFGPFLQPAVLPDSPAASVSAQPITPTTAISATSTVSASVTRLAQIIPTQINATSTVSGAVVKLAQIKPTTNILATSTVSGSVVARRAIIPAQINATSTVSGAVTKLARITPTQISATSVVSGTVTKLAAVRPAQISAFSTVSGTVVALKLIRPVQISATATVSGVLTRLAVISGNILATSTVSGAVSGATASPTDNSRNVGDWFYTH